MAKKNQQADKPDKIYPVFVLCGNDRRRMVDQTHFITDMVVGDDDPQLVITSFDGDKVSLPEVLDELLTFPFLSQYRLVIINEADKFITANREKLEAYLEKPSKTGILLMQVKTFPATTKLAKKAAQIGWVQKYEELTAKELPGFITDYAKNEYGLKFKADAVSLLIGLTGDSAGQLINEVDKIAAYLSSGNSKEITEKEIEMLVGNNRQYDAFSVIDAMANGNVGLALNLLDQMLGKTRDSEFTAVGAFAWYFRKLYSGRLMYAQKHSPYEIPRAAGVWHNQEAFMKLVKAMPGKKIATGLQRLTQIDYASKSGLGTVKDGLEKFIVEFCT